MTTSQKPLAEGTVWRGAEPSGEIEVHKRMALSPEIDGRANSVMMRSGLRVLELQDKAKRISKSQAPAPMKYIRLVEIADEMLEIVHPVTPCRRGCSSCCYIAVPISLSEAEQIAKVTGRALDPTAKFPPAALNPSASVARLEDNILRYEGKPCTFLKGNECSIYADRPIPCRTHHVIEDNATKCDTRHGRQPVAQFDVSWIDYAAADIAIREPWADMREFFPPLDRCEESGA